MVGHFFCISANINSEVLFQHALFSEVLFQQALFSEVLFQ